MTSQKLTAVETADILTALRDSIEKAEKLTREAATSSTGDYHENPQWLVEYTARIEATMEKVLKMSKKP